MSSAFLYSSALTALRLSFSNSEIRFSVSTLSTAGLYADKCAAVISNTSIALSGNNRCGIY